MLRRALVILAGLALPLGLLAAVPAPASAATAPTLKALPASSQVGKSLTLRGTAPPGAVVTVQRRYGSGAFARVGSVRATRSGAWAVRARLTRGGTTGFRAAAGGRTSSVRTLKVYQWLNVVDQAFASSTSFARYDVVSRVGGTALPKSIEANGVGYVVVKTAGLCTQLRYVSGTSDLDRVGRDGDENTTGEVQRFDGGGTVGGIVPWEVLSGDGALTFTVPLTSGSRTTQILAQRFVANDPDGSAGLRSVLGTSQVLCNTTRLPELQRTEFPD